MDFSTDISFSVDISKTDQEKLISKLLGDWKGVAEVSHNPENNFSVNIETVYKPKRLPRKLKKAYKNGKQWAIAYYQKKYPKYYFEECTFEPGLTDKLLEDGMIQEFNINYYNSKYIKYL